MRKLSLGIVCIALLLTGCGQQQNITSTNTIPEKKAKSAPIITKLDYKSYFYDDTIKLHSTANSITEYGKYNKMYDGDQVAWKNAIDSYPTLRGEIEQAEINAKKGDVKGEAAVLHDLNDLSKLLTIASSDYNAHKYAYGANALLMFHRVSTDIEYFWVGKGEKYGVATCLGSNLADRWIAAQDEQRSGN